MEIENIFKSDDYNDLLLYYDENKEKDFNEWLNHESTLKKLGKQGIVGLLNTNKIIESIENNETKKIFFKMSQYNDNLIQHESIILEGLNEISIFCPHFCKSFGTIKCKINPENKNNPFDIDTLNIKKDNVKPIEKDILLFEYINNSTKFYNYIRANDRIIAEHILYSTIKQVLLAISIAQHKKKFTHYDLHSNNIMMKKCDKDLVFLYVLDKDTQLCVPTFGHYPIIIDFGFSYIENLEDGPLWSSMGHTKYGFTSNKFDHVNDAKLFLVTVSNEIKLKRKSKDSKKLRRIVHNIFNKLNIDWVCGWDENIENKSSSDYIISILSDYSQQSKLFKDYDHYCIDLITSLIILPFEEKKYKSIYISYDTFIKEWINIENIIGSPFYNLYVLKKIIDVARDIRADYQNDENTRIFAIKKFRDSIKLIVDEIGNFCVIKHLNYEKMLCSLYLLSESIEGILYIFSENRTKKIKKDYNKLPLQSIEQIFAAIDCNFKDNYTYNENTNICIIDSINNTNKLYKIPIENLENLNKLHQITKGTYLYDLYKTNN